MAPGAELKKMIVDERAVCTKSTFYKYLGILVDKKKVCSRPMFYKDLKLNTEGTILRNTQQRENETVTIYYLPKDEPRISKLDFEGKGVGEQRGILALEDRILETIRSLSFRDQYWPPVNDIIMSIGESPENQEVRDLVYKVSAEIGWQPPTDEEYQGSPARVWCLLALGVLVDMKNVQRLPKDLRTRALWTRALAKVGKDGVRLAKRYARDFPERAFRLLQSRREFGRLSLTIKIPDAVVQKYKRLEVYDKDGFPINFGMFHYADKSDCKLTVEYPHALGLGDPRFFYVGFTGKNSRARGQP